ncbi:MAG: class I SAM-dependent methyltransferase [Methanomicrobiaceae archaeon]|nr:class I SAM-dependent methyltransferase [Methanomicrobiaceae archaeon]
MELDLLCSLFEGLPRQGPGDFEHTHKAFRMLSGVPKGAKILDIGCGKGMQTIALAKLCPDCLITAVDIHQPFLDALNENAAAEGFSDRIKTVCASMDDLSFDEGEFDIIWAEGSIFIIGFEKGINYWKKFLKQDGFMMASDLVLFTENPPEELMDFLKICSPDPELCSPKIMTEDEGAEMANKAGFNVWGTFRLPANVWYDSYYNYVKENNKLLREKYRDNKEVLGVVEFNEKEMEVHSRYQKEYGYAYFVIQKN